MGKLDKKGLRKCVTLLSKAFLRWGNSKSSLSITGGKITLEIAFQEPDSDNTKLSEDMSDEGSEEHQEEATQSEDESDSEQKDAVTESCSHDVLSEDIHDEDSEEHQEEATQSEDESDSEQKTAVTESYSHEVLSEGISDEGSEEATQGEDESDSEQKDAVTESCSHDVLSEDMHDEDSEEHQEEATRGEDESDSEQKDAVTESYSHEVLSKGISDEDSEEHQEEATQSEDESDSEQKDAVTESCSHEVLSECISDEGSEEHQEEATRGEDESDSEQKTAVTESYSHEVLSEDMSKVSATKGEESESDNPSKRHKRNTSPKIPELEEIAQKSTSFDNFAELVVKWLEVPSKAEVINELLIASKDVDKLTWNAIKSTCENRNIHSVEYAKVLLTYRLKAKFSECNMSIMPFLKEIRNYGTYPFKQIEESSEESYVAEQEEGDKQVPEEPVAVAIESTEPNETIISEEKVKMDCMPEIEEFEEVLANVNKTQSVKERIRYVLEAMGLETFDPSDRMKIIAYASKRIVKKKADADADAKANGDLMNHMLMSKLINNFVKKYDLDRKVSCNTFICELREIIMLESEIEE